jgi:hypothetical protein
MRCPTATQRPALSVSLARPRVTVPAGCDAWRKPAVGVVCTCPHIAVLICNSNAITDDRWTVSLNGRAAGEYNVGDELRAMLILPDVAEGLPVTGHPSPCTVFDTTYAPELTNRTGGRSLRLRMTLAEIKGFGNYGTVQFVCCCVAAGLVTMGDIGGSFTYGNPSPYVVGSRLDYRVVVSAAL